jgi:hypothetical protein
MSMFITDSQLTAAYDPAVQASLRANPAEAAIARARAAAPVLQNALCMAAEQRGMARDSVPSDRGAMLAQQLEHIVAEIKELKRPALNALELFPIDRSIPAFAQTYKQRRKDGSARVEYHRGQGSAPPTASMEIWEEEFQIHTAVTGIRYSIFDLQHGDFAGLNLRAELMKISSRGVDEFLNSNCWFGNAANGVRGVLTNTFCSRRFASAAWTLATPAATILAELQAGYDSIGERSKDVFMADKCALPPILHNALKRKLSAYDPETILEAFLKANPELSADTFVRAHELANAGPSGQHVLFWYKGGDMGSVAHVLPKEMTMLTPQLDGFEVLIPGYMRYGGVRMDEPLFNLITYIPAS